MITKEKYFPKHRDKIILITIISFQRTQLFTLTIDSVSCTSFFLSLLGSDMAHDSSVTHDIRVPETREIHGHEA